VTALVPDLRPPEEGPTPGGRAEPPPATYFDRTTAVAPRPSAGAGTPGDELDGTVLFDGVVAERWASLRAVHGGYLTALAVRAVEQVVPDRAVRTVATTFLRPGALGPIELAVTLPRSGRSVTTATVELRQVGRTVALVRATAVAPVGTEDWDRSVALDLPPISECVPLSPPPGILHFEHAEAVLDPTGVPFASGDDARVGGWVRPREPRPIDAAWLAMILDWFPPAPFSRHALPVGGVSVDYAVHLHATAPALPGGDWLGARFEAERGADGLALEKGRLHAPDGALLAESFHTRWTGA
jgi:acyl-CoA thioesterase